MNWHARQITRFQQKFDLSNYQINWIAYGKGLVTGLIIGLSVTAASAHGKWWETTTGSVVFIEDGKPVVLIGCRADISYDFEGNARDVTMECGVRDAS